MCVRVCVCTIMRVCVMLTTEGIEEKTRQLQQTLSLSHVQQYHKDGDHDKVVDLLLPIFHQDIGAFLEVTLTW